MPIELLGRVLSYLGMGGGGGGGGGGGPLHHVDTEFSVLGWDLLRVISSTCL